MLTNRANLPESIVRAVQNDPYSPGDCDISVTSLIAPPQVRVLKKRHGHEITEDVSDRIWSLLGQAVHSILERIDDGSSKERRLFLPVNGWIVSGQYDRYFSESIIDYKITSVWSVKQGVKTEWEQQLNCLAALARGNGMAVNKLGIVAIMRDWRKNEAMQYADYPKTQVATIPIPVWPQDKAVEFLQERVSIHQKAEYGDCIPCSNEERWYRGEKWAVMKKGRKSAVRLFDSEESAKEWIEKKQLTKGHTVVHRPGTFNKCEQYCSVSKFCPQLNGH